MYFDIKNYLKSNRNHTAKHIKLENNRVGFNIIGF